MRTGSETLIFWGAGATATTGQSTTWSQVEFILELAKKENEPSLAVRVDKALRNKSPAWAEPFTDLLSILGDDVAEDIYVISESARTAMRRHWDDTSPDAIEKRIHALRAQFDWSALKSVIQLCPGFPESKDFKLTDLFNIIDMHCQSGHGFIISKGSFLPHHRIIAARRALALILQTLLYIDWQTCLTKNRVELEKHLGFARLLAKHHQEKGLTLAASGQFSTREFYLGDVAFVSLNYDPIALWAQFIANKEANDSPPFVGFPAEKLKIFHDFSIFMAVSTITDTIIDGKEKIWYPLNEASAQRLNDEQHNTGRRVRINKCLFPHGCLCWRECPNCGKLTAYMGKRWDIASETLIPPPPLRGFVRWEPELLPPETNEEEKAWQQGEVDARSCVHCDELSYAQHTQTVMQSNFKALPPSFIEEVQRDLRVAVQSANHIILMGYSLPPDDVTYRAFFAARKRRAGKDKKIRCSVVVDTGYGDEWHYPEAIDKLLSGRLLDNPCDSPKTTLDAARAIFGKENVRFYGGGIPNVFCESNAVSRRKFDQLIDWESKVL